MKPYKKQLTISEEYKEDNMGLSLNVNKSGIKAQQLALDAISNNIANATTEGYKAKGVRFQSLLTNEITEDDVLLNDITPGISAGVRSEVAVTDFSQGNLREGTSSLNLAVAGEGFFAVEDSTGELYLTRDGSFTVDGAGQLVNNNGDYLVMDGAIPATIGGSNDISVANDGTVSFIEDGENITVGNINMYMPENVEGLVPVGDNYYIDPNDTVNVFDGGSIEASMSEMSNVDLASELTNMIMAQRAYSLNVKVAQSTDEIMSMINQFGI